MNIITTKETAINWKSQTECSCINALPCRLRELNMGNTIDELRDNMT
jgi:hypothetical protein